MIFLHKYTLNWIRKSFNGNDHCDVFVVRFYFVNILYTLAPLTMRSLPNSDSRGVPRDSKIEY